MPLTGLVLLALTCNVTAGDKPHWAFHALQATYCGSNYVDYVLTTTALRTGRYEETNPIVAAYLDSPALALCIITAANYTTCYLTNWLHKRNKPIAYTILIAISIAKTYAIYRGIQALE